MFPVSTVMCPQKLYFEAKLKTGFYAFHFPIVLLDQITLHCLDSFHSIFKGMPHTKIM